MRSTVIVVAMLSAGSAQAAHELDGRDIVTGATLYAENCASCHGADLEGQPDWRSPDENGVLPAPPHDETGHTWHHDNKLLFNYTKLGGAATMKARGFDFDSGMPEFQDSLTDAEIWNILAFIRSTWPQQVQDMQALRNPPHD
ncbi:MAG: c-type cytochrome [Pseudomonadota bacterium]